MKTLVMLWNRISDPRSVWIMVHQGNQWILGQSGFLSSFEAPWSRHIYPDNPKGMHPKAPIYFHVCLVINFSVSSSFSLTKLFAFEKANISNTQVCKRLIKTSHIPRYSPKLETIQVMYRHFQNHACGKKSRGGGGTPIWNRRGCSSEILNLTPKGDHLGVAQGFCDP